jgi:prefoldin subunit 5
MCLASKYLGEIESVITRIEKDKKVLSERLSQLDKELSNVYHKIEVSRFNACEGYYLAKQLQEVLHKRRIVKDELTRFRSLKDSLGLNNQKIDSSKKNLTKHKNEAAVWKKNWNHTYTLEEVLH